MAHPNHRFLTGGESARPRPRAAPDQPLAREWDDAVTGRGLHMAFQNVVSLPGGRPIGVEALARWGSGVQPEAVFARATASGHLWLLDRLCIKAAIKGALAGGLSDGSALFINCEATTPYVGLADDDLVGQAMDRFRLIFELTERSLAAHPAALLQKVAALRSDGFGIALDDVGAQPDSLALLDVVAPDVIKLDLALVQSQPRYHQARTWASVLAHHEHAGATVCAEGIETGEHLHRAMALGASLGQGYLFGRPGPLNADVLGSSHSAVQLSRRERRTGQASPFDTVADSVPTRVERKDTVLALARYIEGQAAAAPDPPIVLAAVQRAEFFEGETRDRYHHMAASSPLVVVYGSDLQGDLGHGVRGARISPTDPLIDQWIVLTLGANTAAAFVAREVGDAVANGFRDGDRRFEVALTNDRALITSVAHSLLTRVIPNGRPMGGPLACA